jgi:DNA-binding transcriptional LysR family regulator
MPDWVFPDMLANGEVVTLMNDWLVQPIPIHLVSPAPRKHSAKVPAFGDHIAECLRASLGSKGVAY